MLICSCNLNARARHGSTDSAVEGHLRIGVAHAPDARLRMRADLDRLADVSGNVVFAAAGALAAIVHENSRAHPPAIEPTLSCEGRLISRSERWRSCHLRSTKGF